MTASVQQRIEAMKVRVAEKKQREEAEEARKNRADRLCAQAAAKLREALAPLLQLPVRPNGVVEEDYNRVEDATSVSWLISLRRRGWADINGETDTEYTALIDFVVRVDHDGQRAWIEHDDSEIPLDVALDLATAAVETNLDA